MARSSIPKELKPWVTEALEAGWDFSRTKSGHYRFKPPTGTPWPIVIISSTSSDWRGNKNGFSLLRQAGLKGPAR